MAMRSHEYKFVGVSVQTGQDHSDRVGRQGQPDPDPADGAPDSLGG